MTPPEGILLIDKPVGITSFRLVAILRRKLNVKKIGHAGTLDPFATGVMVLLVGRNYTRLSDSLLGQNKAYRVRVRLGVTTDSYDCEGQVMGTSELVPSLEQVQEALQSFQGAILQTPPMFSAKKVGGKKLYELARKGEEVERKAVEVTVQTQLKGYEYPYLDLEVSCTKGTYIRSIAHDLGVKLGCGAHAEQLRRTESGQFKLEQCISFEQLEDPSFDLKAALRK